LAQLVLLEHFELLGRTAVILLHLVYIQTICVVDIFVGVMESVVVFAALHVWDLVLVRHFGELLCLTIALSSRVLAIETVCWHTDVD